MSLFGPTIIGGGSGASSSGSSGSAPAPAAAGLSALALRVSPDANTVQVQIADGSWQDTGLLLETTTDAAGNVVSIGLRTS